MSVCSRGNEWAQTASLQLNHPYIKITSVLIGFSRHISDRGEGGRKREKRGGGRKKERGMKEGRETCDCFDNF